MKQSTLVLIVLAELSSRRSRLHSRCGPHTCWPTECGPLSPELQRLGYPRRLPGSYQGVPTLPWTGLAPAALTHPSRHTHKSVTTRSGTLPIAALERAETIEDFKQAYGQTRSITAVSRTLGILRHAINWGRGRTPPILGASPFHRFGVKIKTKVETKRDRRIPSDEERKLLGAADKLNCADHAFAGAQMRDRIIGALETGCRLGEMLKIQNRHVLWDTHQIIIPAEHARDAESRHIPFEPNGRLSQILKRRRFLGQKAFVFGTATGAYQGTIRTAWESIVLLAHDIKPSRTRAHGRVNREQLGEIDLHWHDLRHEAACRWLAKGLDLRAIQLLLGHADLKTTQRYLIVTDEELRRTMHEKLWSR